MIPAAFAERMFESNYGIKAHSITPRRGLAAFMPFGFYIIMAAQFFSSLADNALLVAAIATLALSNSPDWLTPMLKLFFTISYVVLAPFVGAFADSLPKGKVMLISNGIKIGGCMMMLFGVHPLIAYGVVGLGAAAYSPAKYGILTEYLPHSKLVVANGWIEGLTVCSIILGTVIGGALVSQTVSTELLKFDMPVVETGIDTAPEIAIALIIIFYAIAAIVNVYVPLTGAVHKPAKRNPLFLISDFGRCLRMLWQDKLGQISLATTTLFWGAGATLQFIVLKWAQVALGYTLAQATILQGITAVGIAIGAIVAAKTVPLHRSVGVLPVGIAMGIMVIFMLFVRDIYLAMLLMTLVGSFAGFFVVPMNALLQHRGHLLMGAGHSIAVQNFNENLSILMMLGVYALLIKMEFSIYTVIALFGLFLSSAMTLVRERHYMNVRSGPIPQIPVETKR
jgi:MFS family permease